ncbi:MAG: POTRA domain-containing protein [Rhizomicrobium sp.]
MLAWAVPAAAQVTLPGPAQIPQAQQRFQPPPPEPHANPAAPVNPPLATAPPPGAQDVRFVLRDITFQGLTVYSPAQLRPLYAPLVGRTISLADLYALAGRITDQYRHDGYLISVAVVPAQPVENGAVTIRIVEGFVDKLRFGGGVDGPKDVLQDLAAPVTASRPLRADDLERSILLIGDLPGVNAQSVLSPSATTFGAADLDVVIQQTPWEGFVSFDNLGSRFLGPYALSAGASEYSRLGLYEQVDLTLALDPIEQTMAYVQGAITVPVVNTGPLAGSTLQVSGLYSRAKPDLPAAVFPFETRSANAEGRLTWFSPLIRSRDQNLSARLAFIWRDLENRITDLPADLRNPAAEHVRVLQPRLTYDVVDGWGRHLDRRPRRQYRARHPGRQPQFRSPPDPAGRRWAVLLPEAAWRRGSSRSPKTSPCCCAPISRSAASRCRPPSVSASAGSAAPPAMLPATSRATAASTPASRRATATTCPKRRSPVSSSTAITTTASPPTAPPVRRTGTACRPSAWASA